MLWRLFISSCNFYCGDYSRAATNRGRRLLPRAAYARVGLSNSFCPSSSVIKIFITGDSESITTSKWEDNDEIHRILAYVYLVEHKAALFSAFF